MGKPMGGKSIKVEGSGEERPGLYAACGLAYSVIITDGPNTGLVLASCTDAVHKRHTLGIDPLPPGFVDKVPTMRRGERAIFDVPPSSATVNASDCESGASQQYDIYLRSWAGPYDITLAQDGGVLKLCRPPAVPEQAPPDPLDIVTVRRRVSVLESGSLIGVDEFVGGFCPVPFAIDDGSTFEGLELSVMALEVGETAEFVISSKYWCNDDHEMCDTMSSDSMLLVKLELLVCDRVSKAMVGLTGVLDKMMRLRKLGNDSVKTNDFQRAIRRYTAALHSACEEDEVDEAEDSVELVELRSEQLACHLNIALCLIKLKKYEMAIGACDVALAIDPTNVKGLFRRGTARIELGIESRDGADIWRAARTDLHLALKADPKSRPVVQATKRVAALLRQQNLADHEQYKAMFSKESYEFISEHDILGNHVAPAQSIDDSTATSMSTTSGTFIHGVKEPDDPSEVLKTMREMVNPAIKHYEDVATWRPPPQVLTSGRLCPENVIDKFKASGDPYIPGDWRTTQCFNCEFVLGQHLASDTDRRLWKRPRGITPLRYSFGLNQKILDEATRAAAWHDYFNGKKMDGC